MIMLIISSSTIVIIIIITTVKVTGLRFFNILPICCVRAIRESCQHRSNAWLEGTTQLLMFAFFSFNDGNKVLMYRGGKPEYPVKILTTSFQKMLQCLSVGCLTSQQHASVSQGRICSDSVTFRHTEIEVADPTFYLTQSQYTDTGPTSPSADPITPGAWQGSLWSANF